jgi:hypothetical protein
MRPLGLFLPPFGFIPQLQILFGFLLLAIFGYFILFTIFPKFLEMCLQHLQNVIWFSTDE